jgi:cytochrome o ubiquinol oxidase subunit IV
MDHAHAASSDTGHGSAKSYITGFIISVILTAAAFGLVMGHVIPSNAVIPVIAILALVQVVVHLGYFLHMNTSAEGRWNLTSFAFAGLVTLILIGGTAWIMFNISMNMMPQ